MIKEKIRTIITQDAEVDDQNSLRHFLLYANEVELQGIVQTSSKFHWAGIPGAVRPERKLSKYEFEGEVTGDYGKPYRWTGTDWMLREIDDYEKDYPNLIQHAEGYPAPDELRKLVKIGNVGYEGETEHPTEGSELIRERILDDDPRTLYLQVWGGTNTIVRALMDIEEAYCGTPEWPDLQKKISKKVVITACGEQDPTYRSYMAEKWPDIQFVKTLQMRSYAYPWFIMPEGESKDTLRSAFMKAEILNGKSALADGYCTWLDGKVYEGEPPEGQFGSNPNIVKEWFGAHMGLPDPVPYDFLSEGDSPTFFLLFDWGFRTLEDFRFGGISGRYHKVSDQFNRKGDPLNVWDVSMDHYTDRDGNVTEVESMWPYVADIQRDFAARVDWCAAGSFEKAEHQPVLRIREGLDFTATPGETVRFTGEAFSRDAGLGVKLTARIYEEASAPWAAETKLEDSDVHEGTTASREPSDSAVPDGGTDDGIGCGQPLDTFFEAVREFSVHIPETASPGDRLHIIVRAESEGHHRLVHYQQVIVTVG